MAPFSQEQLIQIWVLASLLGLIPGFIAHRKGRSFGLWWLYGSMMFIVALIHSLLIKPLVKRVEPVDRAAVEPRVPSLPEGTKKCCACDQLMGVDSERCPVCKAPQPPLTSFEGNTQAHGQTNEPN
jgi:hypothetical protein